MFAFTNAGIIGEGVFVSVGGLMRDMELKYWVMGVLVSWSVSML